jgi:hypothetical protein
VNLGQGIAQEGLAQLLVLQFASQLYHNMFSRRVLHLDQKMSLAAGAYKLYEASCFVP